MGRTDAAGESSAEQYTTTGHLDNHFAIGPAILWSPFLFVAHVGVLLCDRLGGQIPADGFSRPYEWRWPWERPLRVPRALDFFRPGPKIRRRSAGLFWQRWAFGSRVRCRCTCISIRRGPTPTPLLRWRCFSGTGCARARRGRGCSGSILGAIGGLMMDVYYVNGSCCCCPFGIARRLLSGLARAREGARVGRLLEEYGLRVRSSRPFCRR